MPAEDDPGELGAGAEADEDVARGGEPDDMKLILDALRKALKTVAEEDPARIAPVAREFRAVVEAVRGPAEPPKELSLADQLAEARAARAARAAGKGASA